MGIRGTTLAFSSSANTLTASLTSLTAPGGGTVSAVAGDLCYVFVANAFAQTSITPSSSWTILNQVTAATWNWYIASRVLSSGDISTGTVVVNFANFFDCGVTLCVFAGAPTQREFQTNNSNNPIPLSCSGAVLNTDIGVYWLTKRTPGSPFTVTPGSGSATVRQNQTSSNAQWGLYTQAMPGGAQTNSFTFIGTGQTDAIQIFVEAGGASSPLLLSYGLDGLGKFGHLKGGING